ncbi:glycosyltransferase family 2 protein [Candidatus Margulisiibacteriota bacterium]
MNITIGIITYKRPQMLKIVLKSINNLQFKKNPALNLRRTSPNGSGKNIKPTVIVVDNDKEKSAQKIVAKMSKKFKWQIKYYCEPKKGIPQARNKVVKEAIKIADFVAFIDDDEEADPYWLDEFIATQKKTNANCIIGKTNYKYSFELPTWYKKYRLLKHPKKTKKHSEIKSGSTNNCLISCKVLSKYNKPFNESLRYCGGSDSDFFIKMHKKGEKIHFAKNAITYEWLHKSRTNARWLIKRTYRLSYTLSKIKLAYYHPGKITYKYIKKSIYNIISGFILLPFSLLRGKAFFVHCLQKIAQGIGKLLGLLETNIFEYKEYKTTHGC